MKIHLVTNLFAPDELAGAALFTDLALFLKERGHDIRATSTFSYYPAWKRRSEDAGFWWRDDVLEGIRVRRVSMYVPARPSGARRLVSDGSFLLNLCWRGCWRDWQPDVIMTALPMFSQCLVQRFGCGSGRIPRLIVVQDFVVDAALELGILNVPGLEFGLRWLERYALRSARTLVTIGPGLLEKLRQRIGPDRRVLMIPNWIHGSLEEESRRQQALGIRREAAELVYAGNLGVKQGLPDFLEQFRSAEVAEQGWRLAIHGGGAERERLAGEVKRTPGCSLGPVLSEPDYVRTLLGATACLVTQRPGLGANFLPSKLLPALATGTPVLGVCDRNSPLGQEVIQGGFGEVVAPGDDAALASTLERWRDVGLRDAMSHKARERAKRYNRANILPQYEVELLALCPNQLLQRSPEMTGQRVSVH